MYISKRIKQKKKDVSTCNQSLEKTFIWVLSEEESFFVQNRGKRETMRQTLSSQEMEEVLHLALSFSTSICYCDTYFKNVKEM